MDQPPVLDLGDRDFRGALDAACRDWGFFYLEGHDVDRELCDAVLRYARRFFSLPPQEKRRIERTKTNTWGFYDQELTKNRRDWKEIFDMGPAEDVGPLAGSTPQWPDDPEFRRTMEAFYDAANELGLELLREIVAPFGRDAESVDADFRDHTSFLRLNYYPTCPNPALADAADSAPGGELGISRHTDAGALTVLLQDDIAGLQVQHRGRWTTLAPRRDAFVINVGDVVQVLSNDAYPAPLHRVLASSDDDRLSAAYFLNPAYSMNYEPLVEPARYRAINWGEFRAARADGDYADVGHEIQISDFRI